MVGQIPQLAGQELAQIARKKRGPFQRSHETHAEAGHKPRRKKSHATAEHQEAVVVKKPEKSTKHKYVGELSAQLNAQTAGSVAAQVKKKSAADGVAVHALRDNAAGRSAHAGLLALQEVEQGTGQGLALGHATGLGRPTSEQVRSRAHEQPAVDAPATSPIVLKRPTEAGRDADSFIKRYQHRDYNAEVALNLLSDGREEARDASLSVKFQAYADSATGKSQDQRFVQQFLNGAEKV